MQQMAAKAEPETPCVLNPLYETSVIQRFDVDHGYQSHHWKCVQAAPKIGSPCMDDLARRGFGVLPALEPRLAAHLADRLKQADRDLGAADLGGTEVETAMRAAFNPTLHAAINRNFLTEFAVIYFGLSLVKAQGPGSGAQNASPSFLWHCDAGPTKFLNVLIYLNGEEEHDGGTAFLDSQTTRSFKRLGYVFGPVGQRLADLSGLADKHGLTYAPAILRPEAGQAVIFEPSCVLHRGITPTRGVRCTLHLVLIPWAETWDRFLQLQPDLLARNQEFGFPKVN